MGIGTYRLPFTNAGGNVLTDGIGSAFLTCNLLTENRYNGITYEFFQGFIIRYHDPYQ